MLQKFWLMFSRMGDEMRSRKHDFRTLTSDRAKKSIGTFVGSMNGRVVPANNEVGGKVSDTPQNCQCNGLHQKAAQLSSRQRQLRFPLQPDRAAYIVHQRRVRKIRRECSKKVRKCFFGKKIPSVPKCSRHTNN